MALCHLGFASSSGFLGFRSLPESAGRFRQTARRFLQVPVGLLKLERLGVKAPLQRQKWFGVLLANTSK